VRDLPQGKSEIGTGTKYVPLSGLLSSQIYVSHTRPLKNPYPETSLHWNVAVQGSGQVFVTLNFTSF